MNDPNLQHVGTFTSARTYQFRSPQPLGGWALCTVNDETGELLIVSDWGNWSHLWNPKHLGRPSLTHFIADRRDCDYLANKLLSGSAWVLDADATIKKWRRELCVQRLKEGREGADDLPYLPNSERLDAHLAREIWDDLGSLHEADGHEAVFIDRAYQIEGFTRWISEEPWEGTEHRYSHEYRALVDFILPALAKVCGETARTQAA